jgi:hypothetical protein
MKIESFCLPALVDPKLAAIDLGANVGKYALALSSLVPTVYAPEPSELSNPVRTYFPKNVKVYTVAAAGPRRRLLRADRGRAALGRHLAGQCLRPASRRARPLRAGGGCSSPPTCPGACSQTDIVAGTPGSAAGVTSCAQSASMTLLAELAAPFSSHRGDL